ncbi:hypothetical protein [Flagellimonas lutaonensis]|uniref:Phenylalanyl-tRNA synthetase subunit alpha n=1 Tax=Flagellimonas lutaonensis TaxID=516051 RepID=A0A0D5YRI5_9FLAO|nr:hypothetical protein [Allomuricauda lutaonensis]AKA34877.1 phenylalanyl-tRNA synthetase subunit alpha [Allomuricauda lutaonensis]
MRKDIEIPIAENVYVAAVNEWDENFLSKDWYVYLINNRLTPIEGIIIVSKGYKNDTKTSTLRRSLEWLDGESYQKIELITEELVAIENEFFVTFFADKKLYERRFIFEPYTIAEKNAAPLPILESEGILAK